VTALPQTMRAIWSCSAGGNDQNIWNTFLDATF